MIKTLKDMDDFLKMCRKQGVAEIKIEGVHLKLSEGAPKKKTRGVEEEDHEDIQTNEPTLEQLAFLSAGIPEQ